MNPERRLRFSGPFDADAGRELEQIASFLIRRDRQAAETVCIDLSGVTRIDADGVPLLNSAWTLLTQHGWSVEVDAPARGAVRWAFVDAAIRGTFAWARGTSAPRAKEPARDIVAI